MGNCLSQCYQFWPCHKNGARLSINFVPTTEPFVASDQFQMIIAGHPGSRGGYARLNRNPKHAKMVHKNFSKVGWMFKPHKIHNIGSKRKASFVKRKVSGSREPYDLYADVFAGLSGMSKYEKVENEDPAKIDLPPFSLLRSISPVRSSSFSDLSELNDKWSTKIEKMSPYTQYLDISGLTELAYDSQNQSLEESLEINLKNWYALPRYKQKPALSFISRDTSPGSNTSLRVKINPRKKNLKKKLSSPTAPIGPTKIKSFNDNKESTNGGSTTYSPIHNTNDANTSNNLSELEWETESLSLLQ